MKANSRFKKAQQRYKRNFNARFCKQRETTTVGNNIYLRVERKNESQHRHKLAAVAKDSYPVSDRKYKTVVALLEYETVDRVNRDHFIIAPAQCATGKIKKVTRLITAAKLTTTTFLVNYQLKTQCSPYSVSKPTVNTPACRESSASKKDLC